MAKYGYLKPLPDDEATTLVGVRRGHIVKVKGKRGLWLVLDVFLTGTVTWAIRFTDYSQRPARPENRPGKGDIIRDSTDDWLVFAIQGDHLKTTE